MLKIIGLTAGIVAVLALRWITIYQERRHYISDSWTRDYIYRSGKGERL